MTNDLFVAYQRSLALTKESNDISPSLFRIQVGLFLLSIGLNFICSCSMFCAGIDSLYPCWIAGLKIKKLKEYDRFSIA